MNKVILITGASSGMGKVTAYDLIKQGHVVYCAARSIDKMKSLEQIGGKLIKLDIAKKEDSKKAVEKIIKEQGRIDVLINNAGFGLYGPVEDIPIKDAQYQFDVNLFGLAYLTQQVLPHMRKQRSGRIINTSSMGGKIYTPLGAWYHATKHALEGWSDCLRIELKPFNIKVVIIEPGGVRTNFGEVVGKQLKKYYDKSAYKAQIKPFIDMMESPRMQNMGTPPRVLARVFAHAATTKNPKRRYVKGMMAKPFMFIRKWFGDGVYEFVLRRAFRSR